MAGHHIHCRDELIAAWQRAAQKEQGYPIEITVSTAPPLVRSPFTEGVTCPHGVNFFIEPTGDQRAKWAREGAP